MPRYLRPFIYWKEFKIKISDSDNILNHLHVEWWKFTHSKSSYHPHRKEMAKATSTLMRFFFVVFFFFAVVVFCFLALSAFYSLLEQKEPKSCLPNYFFLFTS